MTQDRARIDQRDGTRVRRAAAAADVRIADLERRAFKPDADAPFGKNGEFNAGRGLKLEDGDLVVDAPALLADIKRNFLEIKGGKIAGKRIERISDLVDETGGSITLTLGEPDTFTSVATGLASINDVLLKLADGLRDAKLLKE